MEGTANEYYSFQLGPWHGRFTLSTEVAWSLWIGLSRRKPQSSLCLMTKSTTHQAGYPFLNLATWQWLRQLLMEGGTGMRSAVAMTALLSPFAVRWRSHLVNDCFLSTYSRPKGGGHQDEWDRLLFLLAGLQRPPLGICNICDQKPRFSLWFCHHRQSWSGARNSRAFRQFLPL